MPLIQPILSLLGLLAAPAALPADVTKLAVSAPVAVVELDLGKLKGQLSRLAWSPDGKQFYVQTSEPEGASVKIRHYLVELDGRPPSATDQEPVWALAYWPWKSAQAAPGLPAFKIDVEQQQKRETSTSTPMGGDMARGATSGGGQGVGTGVSTTEAAAAAQQSQMVRRVTLRLKGEVIGDFVNAPAMPGLTFGWGPAGSGVIAFSRQDDGRLVLMDEQGRKQEVASSKGTMLPAWSNDGRRLAYLEKTARKKFQLKIVDVTRPAQ